MKHQHRSEHSRRTWPRTAGLACAAAVLLSSSAAICVPDVPPASARRFERISEGFVSRRQENTPTAVAAGSRCALAPNGDVVCTFVVQSKIGVNDFKPMLSRSNDGGVTWREQGMIWPHLAKTWSIFGSVSRAPRGELFFFGFRTRIDKPGESFWSDATQGMKPNELIWARSADGGHTWSELSLIPMPIPGAAEAPGAMSITRGGRWLCCYSPYKTFDPKVEVDRSQVVVLFSSDQGKSWRHTSMIRFADRESSAAEAWVIELADGRLLGTTWHVSAREGVEHPNPYTLSTDGGATWTSARSTGIVGQSTALAALPDGRALLIYNQRKHGEPGVYLALARPTAADFGVEANELIWRAATRTQSGTSGEYAQWTDFSFGEPSITLLGDNTLLTTLWCIQPSGRGIRYVKLRMRP